MIIITKLMNNSGITSLFQFSSHSDPNEASKQHAIKTGLCCGLFSFLVCNLVGSCFSVNALEVMLLPILR